MPSGGQTQRGVWIIRTVNSLLLLQAALLSASYRTSEAEHVCRQFLPAHHLRADQQLFIHPCVLPLSGHERRAACYNIPKVTRCMPWTNYNLSRQTRSLTWPGYNLSRQTRCMPWTSYNISDRHEAWCTLSLQSTIPAGGLLCRLGTFWTLGSAQSENWISLGDSSDPAAEGSGYRPI